MSVTPRQTSVHTHTNGAPLHAYNPAYTKVHMYAECSRSQKQTHNVPTKARTHCSTLDTSAAPLYTPPLAPLHPLPLSPSRRPLYPNTSLAPLTGLTFPPRPLYLSALLSSPLLALPLSPFGPWSVYHRRLLSRSLLQVHIRWANQHSNLTGRLGATALLSPSVR